MLMDETVVLVLNRAIASTNHRTRDLTPTIVIHLFVYSDKAPSMLSVLDNRCVLYLSISHPPFPFITTNLLIMYNFDLYADDLYFGVF